VSRPITATFTADEWELMAEALDSHLYWQVSPEERRDSGNVLEPLTDEERGIEALEGRIHALLRDPA
jgi:hypothetical protein